MIPKDTRLLELVTSIAIFLSGLNILYNPDVLSTTLTQLHNYVFWAIITLSFSVIQMVGCTFLYRATHMRAIVAWITGSLLISASIGEFGEYTSLLCITTFVVGIGNLYAFVINALVVRNEWK